MCKHGCRAAQIKLVAIYACDLTVCGWYVMQMIELSIDILLVDWFQINSCAQLSMCPCVHNQSCMVGSPACNLCPFKCLTIAVALYMVIWKC